MIRLLICSLFLSIFPQKDTNLRSAKPLTEPSKIQVALLLDTSNSMDGLIDQARSQLWKMVNRLSDAQKQNEGVLLEIALYEYGNRGLEDSKGFLRLVQPMASDLDGLSEQLFALKTNGGDEFCGWVIQSSLDSLQWSNAAEDLRLIIIAGNEPFDQGPIDFRQSCENANAKEIIVNTIFCGNYEEGKSTHWFDCSQITKGKYANIDANASVVHIATPYDSTLVRLNTSLNNTYIGFGQEGKSMKSRQLKQDANAASYGASNIAQRAAAKSKKSYSNANWDVVDAAEADEDFIEKMEEDQKPDIFKGKTKAEIAQQIEVLKTERTAIQTELGEVQKQMEAYQAAERKKMSAEASNTLDDVLISALVEQAKARGFVFEK